MFLVHTNMPRGGESVEIYSFQDLKSEVTSFQDLKSEVTCFQDLRPDVTVIQDKDQKTLPTRIKSNHKLV